MAADILIYNADLVPVGVDQKQHLELARNIAQRFNFVYGDTFVVPDGYFNKTGAKIMSLQEPDKKMSKSDTNVNSFVLMLDDPDTIVRKFKRAVTDSDGCVRAAQEKPGVTNLMSIYSVFTGKDFAAIEHEFEGRGYGELKMAVAQSVIDVFAPIQAEYKRILADKTYLDGVLTQGAQQATACLLYTSIPMGALTAAVLGMVMGALCQRWGQYGFLVIWLGGIALGTLLGKAAELYAAGRAGVFTPLLDTVAAFFSAVLAWGTGGVVALWLAVLALLYLIGYMALRKAPVKGI